MFLTMTDAAIAPQLEEFHLDNGLRVLVLRRPFAPTFAAYYHFAVGSAHDPPGRSGIAHLLEHMMFKGTRRIGTTRANEYTELVTRAGGQGMNATTSYDLTRYYVQLPANRLEMWFSLEAQRLMEPVFREFETEREVVLQERKLRYDNVADGRVHEEHRRLLYPDHPYGIPVIGESEDIKALRREDAEAYFHTWYSPSNCTMILVGDIDPRRARELAEEKLGPWQRQQLPERSHRLPSPPTQARRSTVEFDAQPYLRMGWVTLPEDDPRHDTLSLLSAVLGELRSSRLNERLVHEKLSAAAVLSFAYGQKQSGSFTIVARPRSDTPLEQLEEEVLATIAEIVRGGVDEAELDRARAYLQANRTRRLASNLSLAMDLGAAIQASGDPAFLDTYGSRLAAVGVDDLREAAAHFLRPEARCVVELHRSREGHGGRSGPLSQDATTSGEHARQAIAPRRDAPHSQGFVEMMELIEHAPPIDFHVPQVGEDVVRRELSTGTTVYWKEDHELPAVTLNAVFTGGYNTAPLESLATYSLAAPLWLEGGAGEWGPAELERRKEELGLRLSLRGGGTSWQLSLWTLSANLDAALELLMTMLRRPRLDEQRLKVLAAKQIEAMRRRADYPDWAVAFLVQKILYGDHPRLGYQPSRHEIEALGREDIAATLARHLGPQNLYVTAVGDFRGEELVARLQQGLSGWRPAGDPRRDWLAREPAVSPGVHIVHKAIPQPAVRILQEIPIDRSRVDEGEHAALEILNRILGGSGFRSHLMERLRTDEGLTYGVSSSLRHEDRPGVPGMLTVSFQTGGDKLARAVEIVEEECRKLAEQPPAVDEVHEQIEAWRNSFLFRFENPAQAVTRLMHHELDDRPWDRDRRLLERIEGVRPEEVRRAAERWLDPSRLSVAVFGSPEPAQIELLQSRHPIRIWEQDEVFSGDY